MGDARALGDAATPPTAGNWLGTPRQGQGRALHGYCDSGELGTAGTSVGETGVT